MTFRQFLTPVWYIYFSLLFFTPISLTAQTIAEKKAGLAPSGNDLNKDLQKYLDRTNLEVTDAHVELKQLYVQVKELFLHNAPESSYKELLDKINLVKNRLVSAEENWRDTSSQTNAQEDYALWHQPETTLEQLVIDYGSQNYVYIVPPEIAAMNLSVDSNLPIPRSSWDEMLEIILLQNGVGIKQLNPYLRQLYLVKNDKSTIRLITNHRQDLSLLPSNDRICFVLTPEPADARRVWQFLDRFVNPNSIVLQMIGRDILVVGTVAEIQDLLKLYDFAANNRGDKEYKAIPLKRIEAEEMAKIIGAIFDQLTDTSVAIERSERPLPQNGRGERQRMPERPRAENKEAPGVNGLKVITLAHVAQAIFLVGTREEIRKAEEIIRDVENQMGEAREKIIYWYTTKHSDPAELAAILEKIYSLMVSSGASEDGKPREIVEVPPLPPLPLIDRQDISNIAQPIPPRNIFDDGYFLDSDHIVNPDMGPPEALDPNWNRNNFIVDLKTGAIVMVVEADILPRLKDLIKKLDVPKKMVQIEVLLFEKKLARQDNIGLNLLRIGDCASQTHRTCFNFNDTRPWKHLNPFHEDFILGGNGITSFFISREKTNSGIPAYDLLYKFLINQDDIQINASPSVLTINQTPALIKIEEEISVNTGIFEIPTTGSVALKDAFARARYGIKIEITPTIHLAEDSEDCDDECDYVTLVTDIIFETIQPTVKDHSRPDVTRRVINNQVRIPDGQTVIIGGLRRKVSDDHKESIPFLGELPGVGKLFSNTQMQEHSTEMFIFITPKIIKDPCEELERLKLYEMSRRPGDIPSFLCELQEAREREKNRVLAGTMNLLFGPEPDRCVVPLGEYDGR